MLACVAISTSFIISNSYILCLLISSDGLASLSCLSFFFNFWGVKYCLLPILISWAGMHHCTASASYFFQLREWSTGGRCKSKCEGEKLDHFYLPAQTSCFQAASKTEQNPNKHTNKKAFSSQLRLHLLMSSQGIEIFTRYSLLPYIFSFCA